MKKIKLFYIICISALVVSQTALAYIYFLPDYGQQKIADGTTPTGPTPWAERCKSEGYTITSCPAGSLPEGECPYRKGYYKSCRSGGEQCLKEGYSTSCPDGYVPDTSQYCKYDHTYIKCKCDPCEGFEYTYEQATMAGYVINGTGCQSCVQMYYKRKENPCGGYNYDESNCNVTECGILSGATCQSGTKIKYKECAACPAPACKDDEWNLDTYWCDGALRCMLPEN